MKVTLLGFDPSLSKAVNNGADSDIKHANSKNDANSKNQNTALKKTLNIYSLNINGLLSHIDELRVRHPHHYLYTPRYPSSSCYPHHHHPHNISSYSSPSLHFFPSPFLHSPFLLYFIIHIWHHLRSAFFCNIMVICSFCVTSDHITILHLICDAKYVSIFLLLSLL